jgi:hypothetical protein
MFNIIRKAVYIYISLGFAQSCGQTIHFSSNMSIILAALANHIHNFLCNIVADAFLVSEII